MSSEVSIKKAERGYQLHLDADKTTGKPVMKLLAFGDNYHFYMNVWVPYSPKAEIPPRFVATVLSINGDPITLGIDCEHLVLHFKNLADAKIIVLKDLQIACMKRSLDQYILNIAQPLRWKEHISWCVKKNQISPLLEFIHRNMAKWKKRCRKQERIYIPISPQIRYPIEYCQDGTLWLHYSQWRNDEMDSLAIDLNTGVSCRALEFSPEVGARLSSFAPHFKNTIGIVQFLEIHEMDLPEPRGNRRIFMGKQQLYDASLDKIQLRCSLENKVKMAQELLLALAFLENKGIVHCGVFPSSIFILIEGNEMESAISNFECAYPHDSLPNTALTPPHKWKAFMPPECSNLYSPLLPFAIPIYQLGMCLKPLFAGDEAFRAILDGMTHPDPTLRLTAVQAMTAFEADRKEHNRTDSA